MVTLKDVAKEAGLTVGTVSRVINNRGYISDKTREKVFRVMDELDYRPNEIARSLSKQRTNTIGVIVPHIEHPYFSKLIRCIEKVVSKENQKMILCNSEEEKEKEIDYIDMFKSNRVDGIILCSGYLDINKFLDLKIPVITIERELECGIVSIECDNYEGGVLAAKHLIKCGSKNIVHFSGIKNVKMPADQRALGFAKTCEKNKVKYKEIKYEKGMYYTLEYHKYIEEILKQDKEIDGIFASSDLIAAQVIQVCSKLDIKIPEDVNLIGFDDVNVASLTTPRITTIRQPVEEMAEQAVYAILKSKEKVVPSKVVLPVELIVRESTRPPTE